ncbi:MAG: ATP-binding cassette domain-containing protein [Spirochaetes bacterium]|nr:ATP-binding cassette domain-containing protein [Spirochaetota bacterium]MCX7037555.1 ATP-binding cassette domain-containing protein [Spirochaetota bacterium]
MVMLQIDGLTRRFGSLVAVDGLSLSIDQGEVFGLLGPNGAGKTTTIKMLTTLLRPSAGTARVAGYDIIRQPREVRGVIGYVPQMLSADASLTAYENLLVFARLYSLPWRQRKQRVRDALEFMGLTDSAHRMVRQYSGGMIRRLEIAQSLLHEPRVLFLDEPTVGLDPGARRAVWDHIRELRARLGATVVLTTHHMDEADLLCHRVAIMHKGKVVALGAPAQLKGSIGGEDATLDDVFIRSTGSNLETGGTYRDTRHARRSARRLG